MTTDYSKLTDSELNEAAARARGWVRKTIPHPINFGNVDIYDKGGVLGGGDCYCYEWQPATDHNHSAEFMEYVSETVPKPNRWILKQVCYGAPGWEAMFVVEGGHFGTLYTRLPRAETIAGLLALDAMKAAGCLFAQIRK